MFNKDTHGSKHFEFGKNWERYLSVLTDERIEFAEVSLKSLLEVDDLNGRSFLDVGSGSGLFSLAARNLGAVVHSFDVDPLSVACTRELRSRFYADDTRWTVQKGSVLDTEFLNDLGAYDIVYAWGVLHHTGDLWSALANVARLVRPNGTLFIAIYNDQDIRSRVWWNIKKFYCSGLLAKAVILSVYIPYLSARAIIKSLLRNENEFIAYKRKRGMSITRDWIDWLGGFPFEYATVEEIFRFCREQGFDLANISTTNGTGNNQFVFAKCADRDNL